LGAKGVRNFATLLYLKFEVFGIWGYVLGYGAVSWASSVVGLPNVCTTSGHRGPESPHSINNPKIFSNYFFDYYKTRL
jgi:hypothetical protein